VNYLKRRNFGGNKLIRQIQCNLTEFILVSKKKIKFGGNLFWRKAAY